VLQKNIAKLLENKRIEQHTVPDCMPYLKFLFYSYIIAGYDLI